MERGPTKGSLNGLQDPFKAAVWQPLPCNEYQIKAGSPVFERPPDTVPEPTFQPVPLYCGRCQLFTYRYSDSEMTRIVRGIKKGKTVNRQPFPFHGRNKLRIFFEPFVFAVSVRHSTISRAILHRETFSSLGPPAVDRLPAARRAHSFSEALEPLLLEIALLRCCFRHRTYSLTGIY